MNKNNKSLDYPKEYYEDILIRFTYHNTGLEGNTLTLADTKSILAANKIFHKDEIDLREVYEVANHKQSFNYMFECLENNQNISPFMIRELNALVTDKVNEKKGQYKKIPNVITGSSFETTPPFEVPFKIEEWCNDINSIDNSLSDEEIIKAIMQKHIEFERIHPFYDGNGRTGRLLINYELLKRDMPLLVIERNDRDEYVYLLDSYDFNGLTKYAMNKIELEGVRRDNFFMIEKQVKGM